MDSPAKQTLCLSSASAPRYKRNIVQVMAYPNEFTTQFRYGRRSVDDEVWNLYKICKLKNFAVLIASLDREGPNGKYEAVPCRRATIKHAEV